MPKMRARSSTDDRTFEKQSATGLQWLRVGISFDTGTLAMATEILQEALETVPNEITIKFFR